MTTLRSSLIRPQEGEVGDDYDEADMNAEKAACSVSAASSEATGMVALPRVLSASTSANSGKPTSLDEKQQPVTEDHDLNLIEEVLNFQTNCPECGAPAETKMKVTSKFP